jgi:hypothetical protein
VTVSTLDTTPRTPVRGVASNAETRTLPYRRHCAAGQALHRAMRPDYFAWLDHVRAAAGCTRPIRLTGDILTVAADTGRLVARTSTALLPDAVIYKACGNRRGTVCPSCSRTYQRDAFEVLRAGLVGGKGVPETVTRHPAVFATFTAPSFGTVHARVVKKHSCRNRRRCGCRPDPCHARRTVGLCQHGRPAVCWARHQPGDALLGRPLCLDCYDHDHHVVWNLYSGELWRRTKQAIDRHLRTLARQRGMPFPIVTGAGGKAYRVSPVRVSHGKAAEFQARGAVHFHALLRLDGVDPADRDAVVPPPAGFTSQDLEDAVRAAAQVSVNTPPHPDKPEGWHVVWGEQLDVKHIGHSGRTGVTDGMVAGYLAKYATKSTEATGHAATRINADSIEEYDPDGDHIARLINACWHIGRPTTRPAPLIRRSVPRPEPGDRPTRFDTHWDCPDCGAGRQHGLDVKPTRKSRPTGYSRLRRWAHMLGFGGHFLTKARRYSITFQLLRDTRINYRRHEDQADDHPDAIRVADHLDEDTSLVIGLLSFAGAGWRTTGDALLANTSADLARHRQTAAREELAHELSTILAVRTAPAAA